MSGRTAPPGRGATRWTLAAASAGALSLAAAIGMAPSPAAGAPAAAAPAAPALLHRLLGRWTMTGHVRGKPVTYSLDADTVLAGQFVRLHLLDVARPPGYEATVFIGWNPERGRLVAHWLVRFGAGFSETLGFGGVEGDTLRLHFDYPEGPFRDTFAWDAARSEWHLLFESGDSTGAWGTFGDYRARRAPR